MRPRIFTVSFMTTLAVAGILCAQTGQFDGTWVFDAAKSKMTGAGQQWKTRTLTITSSGENRKFQSDGVTLDGKTLSGGYDAKFDGKDYPVTGGLNGADSIALKQSSPKSVSFTMKRAGKVVATGTSTVSADGKTLTMTGKGTAADGTPVTYHSVYHKK